MNIQNPNECISTIRGFQLDNFEIMPKIFELTRMKTTARQLIRQ